MSIKKLFRSVGMTVLGVAKVVLVHR